jgi:hypothetical protein
MNWKAAVVCPYCGTGQTALVDTSIYGARLVWCDDEAGGCGHQFVITPTVVVTATVDALESQRAAYEAQKRAQEAAQ